MSSDQKTEMCAIDSSPALPERSLVLASNDSFSVTKLLFRIVDHCTRTASTSDMEHASCAKPCHFRLSRQIAQMPYATRLPARCSTIRISYLAGYNGKLRQPYLSRF